MLNHKLINILSFLFIFSFFYLFNVNFTISPNSLFASKLDIYKGISAVAWRSDISQLLEKQFISKTAKNSYFKMENVVSPFEDIDKPDNIYAGYYFDKLQSVQYIYSDAFVYDKLINQINNDMKKDGEILLKNKDEEIIAWCDSSSDSYIALYKVLQDSSTQIVFAISDKNSIDEELNYSPQEGLPAGVCYRKNH